MSESCRLKKFCKLHFRDSLSSKQGMHRKDAKRGPKQPSFTCPPGCGYVTNVSFRFHFMAFAMQLHKCLRIGKRVCMFKDMLSFHGR